MFSLTPPQAKSGTFHQLTSLIHWSLIRHKYLLPVFTVVQIFLSIAIIYGLGIMFPELTHEMSIYLSSGAVSLGIIAVGCVLSGQIINTAKNEGVVDYQKSLPVSRVNILLADIIIWGFASLPGIFMSFLASFLRFDLEIHFSIVGIFILALCQVSMILIGFTIAYWFPENMVALFSQIIMIGGLLFSPITYSPERLPEWTSNIYNSFPFVPSSRLIRTLFFERGEISLRDISVIWVWLIFCFILSLQALKKRG
ncbi:MAG: ABC transporter permease [Streptococcaceae bacterium]|jgi:ABC-2 type transport system permease protein|nr:ABC transporter permease [Streptococcaceae bacterium]